MSGMKRLWYGSSVVVTMLVLILVAGCGPSPEISLDAGDNGSQLEMKKGQELVVTLASNPTTGFRWECVAPDNGSLAQIGEAAYQEQPRKGDMVGVGGQETWRFKAEKSGQTTLELVYRQPWDKEAKPAERFSVQVTILD